MNEALVARWRCVPRLSLRALRGDTDAVLDPDL
jgi:hypothetical protein